MSSDKKLIVSASPHVGSNASARRIMLDVIIALSPSLVAATIIFGFRSLAVTAVSIISCVFFEYISRKAMKRPNTIGDLSAVVTGLLLAYNLPVSIPLWMAVIGSAVAIVVVKQMFGGIGQNFVNPALLGRIVLLASFPTAMATWTSPFAWQGAESTTTATPLALMQEGGAELPSLMQMLLGVRQGCLGEICALALIAGGLYLVARKVISPAIPLAYIGTFAVIMLIAGKGDFEYLTYQIMGGGLLLGAIYMATDYTTSPINFKGRIVFGIGCGIITALIRIFGSLPEGVSFSIILMNILVPHIESLTTPKPFGVEKEKRVKKSSKKEKEAV
ncbi:MAG TPA: RnfABCDGE type electron transport complex subunit D [Clostridia bacterium]|nr:RnfABCDGE type electron transport complex subunit D [Clostridia bacterium]